MRPLWKDILAAVWLGMILPGIVLNAFVLKERHRENQQVQAVEMTTVPKSGHMISVRDPDGICTLMDLEVYLTGVLLAEMPVHFHEEALKAQSVAARTYAWKAVTTGGKHGDGSVCIDSACCQAYIPVDRYLAMGGNADVPKRMSTAVQTTAPMVLSYDGSLIEATYFSSSGGTTEAALAVWGADYPYLQSVSSPEEDPHCQSVSYTPEQFQTCLGKNLEGNHSDWFGTITYTDGGGVEFLEICGETYSGVEIRSLLGLRSTAFSISPDTQNIIITTKGYGHRVGMSQYGANYMANDGHTWQKILQHYYPGTIIHPIS